MKEGNENAGAIYAKEYTDWLVKTGGSARDMTMRDYFAGLAMQGFCTNRSSILYVDASEEAYRMADAMLKERAK